MDADNDILERLSTHESKLKQLPGLSGILFLYKKDEQLFFDILIHGLPAQTLPNLKEFYDLCLRLEKLACQEYMMDFDSKGTTVVWSKGNIQLDFAGMTVAAVIKFLCALANIAKARNR